MHPRLHAQTKPDAPALIFAPTGEVVTYRDLEARANRGAQLFRRLGLETGDAIALISDNRPEMLDIYWAAQRSGMILVPVSSHLKTDEIAYILNDSSAKLVVLSDALAETTQIVAGIRASLPALSHILSLGPVEGIQDYLVLAAAQPASPIADEAPGGRMVYSSGTTGRPKGIRFPGAAGSPIQPNPGAALFGRLYGLDDGTVYLSPAPLYHSAPLGITAGMQALGGTVVLLAKFDAAAMLTAIARWQVTAMQVVPTMFIRLLGLPEAERAGHDLSSLKTVIHAAAPCPIQVKQAMIDWFGPIIWEYYAGSEGVGHTSINSEEWLRKVGSVGRAVVGQIHICDDDGDELPTGAVGTIYFSGGRTFAYHNDAAKTAASRNPQHPDWATMGDLGRVDDDGYLFLSDRKDFMIISGGVNIYPQEVENLLITHPAVADAAVFGVPNATFGEEVKAVIQPADWSCAGDALAKELMAFAQAHLADLKCPRSIDFDRALPRTETGKLFKKELKARYWPVKLHLRAHEIDEHSSTAVSR